MPSRLWLSTPPNPPPPLCTPPITSLSVAGFSSPTSVSHPIIPLSTSVYLTVLWWVPGGDTRTSKLRGGNANELLKIKTLSFRRRWRETACHDLSSSSWTMPISVSNLGSPKAISNSIVSDQVCLLKVISIIIINRHHCILDKYIDTPPLPENIERYRC